MASDATTRFLQVLKEDAELARQRAQQWDELRQVGARLEDLEGHLVSTADQMIEHFKQQEKTFRDLIARLTK